MGIVANPRAYKIPDWFLNRQKDHKTGRFAQVRAVAVTVNWATAGWGASAVQADE